MRTRRRSRPSPMRQFTSRQRREIRYKLLIKYGPYCQLCLLADKPWRASFIDLEAINQPNSWSVDHIIPMSRGGKNVISNMWPSHKGCNTNRGNEDLEENGG